jgi:hypothetical protein
MSNQMLKRVQALQNYVRAMEDGDIETVATMLEDAEQDRALESMILEVNAGFQYEDRTSIQANDVARAHQLMRSEEMDSPSFHAEDAASHILTDVTTEQPVDTDSATPVSTGRKFISPVFPARIAPRQKWYRSPKSWMAAAAAIILLSFVLFQSNSVLASQFLSFFQVQHFKPIQVSNNDIAGLSKYSAPSIDDLGSLNFQAQSIQKHTNLTQAEAAHAINFTMTLPQQLPSDVDNNPTFNILSGTHGTFTFSAAKVHAYLVKNGHGNVKIPANLNGATFDIKTTPGVMAIYGYKTGNLLALVEMPSPIIEATGKASLQNLRDFMLSLPNLPAQLVAQLKQLDLNNGTIPLPIPAGIQTQSVTIHNVPGLLLSSSKTSKSTIIDQFPAGTMLLWQENGTIYALGGLTINASQLLTAANSLH